MRQVIKLFVGLVLTIMAASGFAQQCAKPNVKECWELVALNVQWDSSNPIMTGLDERPDHAKQTEQAGLERQQRMRDLGPQLWHAQHAGAVKQAKARSFIVMFWNSNPAITDAQVTGFKMNSEKTSVNRIVPENVTGKIVAPKGMGSEPDRVYRIYADGISTSLQFPWALITAQTKIIVCAEDKEGIYPNKVTLNQGHFIGSKTLGSLKEDGSTRGLMPFLSKS
ncbi:MAG: hypothetical protein WAW13_01780 [Minisyncoccia bacterium]